MGDNEELCLGTLCFARPHSDYVLPAYYKRFAAPKYRWKLGAELTTHSAVSLKIQRLFELPNCIGLGNDARWRWQWYPVSFILGMRMDAQWKPSYDEMEWPDTKVRTLNTIPYARLKVLSPTCGRLALRPVLELYPTPCLSLRRSFDVGSGSTVTLRAGVELAQFPRLKVDFDWHPTKTAKAMLHAHQDSISLEYSRQFKLSDSCRIVATGLAQTSRSGAAGSLPVRVKFESLKITQIIGTQAKRCRPAPLSKYLAASRGIGHSDAITIVPGHWIDPGYEAGAPGEREFNWEVATILEKQLRRNGWEVLRPDRDAPGLSWEEYLNWVSKQTLKGTPVLEIHGQGSTADYRGLVLGVIGDEKGSLSKELAKDFGFFGMDWTDLGVPRRGGIILEGFNSDEVLQMAPFNRSWAARRLASRISCCIERASSKNRVARGVEDEFLDHETLTLNPKS